MSMLELRPAIVGDVEQMAALHIAASHQAYAGLISEQALRAITPAERTRRWAESLATLGSDEAIIVGVSNAQVLGFGHCGLQRTPMLPFPGEFFCAYVAPEAQRHGVGTAVMIAMARFLVGRRVGAASLWVARNNVPARRFYDGLGGVVWAERQQPRPDIRAGRSRLRLVGSFDYLSASIVRFWSLRKSSAFKR
jgi:ribosomal protein S18 acetylase RimI-like enzyme